MAHPMSTSEHCQRDHIHSLVEAAAREVAAAVPLLFPASVIAALKRDGVVGDAVGSIREALGNALIAAPAGTLPEPALLAVDDLLAAEAVASVSRTPLSEVTPGAGRPLPEAMWAQANDCPARLAVWRGDLLSLRVDAVVNAANDGGCGCFVPSHRCVDNIVHRGAGPRLRVECAEAMASRPGGLVAGSPPIVTNAYHLHAGVIVHVTGPQLRRGAKPTAEERRLLALAYTNSLDAAAEVGARTIVFPCLSAGLFCFPTSDAANVALDAVTGWLSEPLHQHAFDVVVFAVYTDADQAAYETLLPRLPQRLTLLAADGGLASPFSLESSTPAAASPEALAIAGSDRLLIVAAAGLSISDTLPNNVYHSADDFHMHYPQATRHGYNTGFEAMPLSQDRSVPDAVKQAHTAMHFLNMRYNFPPTDGYNTLKQLADTFAPSDVFVWTSNVDGCFERSGFDPSRV
jgi:O-acetyl-ADP-ribose deacetylase (regulator of RNase III)